MKTFGYFLLSFFIFAPPILCTQPAPPQNKILTDSLTQVLKSQNQAITQFDSTLKSLQAENPVSSASLPAYE